jgi:hypothetical protein
MSDPVLLQSAQAAPGESLWEKAPAWRGLVTAASLFTVLAVATPALLPADAPAAATPHRVAQQPKAQAPLVAAAPAPVSVAPAPVAPIAVTPTPHPAPVHAPPQLASLQPAPQPVPQIAPQVAPQAQPNVCLLTMAPAPTGFGQGMVMSFEDHATSLARIKMTEARAGGQIDPDYVDNQRVTLHMGNGSYQVFLVPRTMHVNLGDRVMVQGGYRNINLPCNYVPNLITTDLGPPPQAAPMAGNAGNPP